MKKLILILIVAVFLIGVVSAFEFDNVKRYDTSTKTMTIKNSILGINWLSLDKVADVQLLNLKNKWIIAGNNKVIAKFKITTYEDYEDIFKSGSFYDIRNLKETSKDHQIKEEIVSGQRLIEDNELDKDGKIVKKSGSHYEDVLEYKDITGMKKGEEKIIVIMTNVNSGDYIDYVPKWFGVEMSEFVPFAGYSNVALDKKFKGNASSVVCTTPNGLCNRINDNNLTIPDGKYDSGHDGADNVTIFLEKNFTLIDIEYGGAGVYLSGGTGFFATDYMDDTGTWIEANVSSCTSAWDSMNISLADVTAQRIRFRGLAVKNWNIVEMRVYGKSTDSVPVVILNSPANAASYTTGNSVRMNCSATDNTQVKNISLYLDGGVINVTKGSTTWLNLSWLQTSISNGNHTWNCKARDNMNQASWYATNYSFNVSYSTLSVTTTLTTPSDNIDNENTTITISGAFNSYQGNLTNATAYVWDSTGAIFKTNKTTFIGTYNTTSRKIQGLIIEDGYKWNYYACAINGTATRCSWATANRTFDVIAAITYQSWLGNVFETSNQTFKVNISIPGSSTLYDANLVYNGTSYDTTPINLGGEGIQLQR